MTEGGGPTTESLKASVGRSPSSVFCHPKVGFPIRKSADQSSFAAPRGLSQRSTSFIASQRQGIHQTPLRHLIALIINARSRDRMPDVRCQKSEPFRPLISDIRPPDSIDRKTSLLRDRPEGARSSNAWMWIAATFGPAIFRIDPLFTMSDSTRRARPVGTEPSGTADAKGFSRTSIDPSGGARRDRTDDLLLAKQALSQLSYGPVRGQRSDDRGQIG